MMPDVLFKLFLMYQVMKILRLTAVALEVFLLILRIAEILLRHFL